MNAIAKEGNPAIYAQIASSKIIIKTIAGKRTITAITDQQAAAVLATKPKSEQKEQT